MEWSETIGELRRERQDVFARQRTRSNCRLYAARGGGRHCQVIPCLFLQGTNHETDRQTMKLQEMIRGETKTKKKHEMTQKQTTAEWEVMERERTKKEKKNERTNNEPKQVTNEHEKNEWNNISLRTLDHQRIEITVSWPRDASSDEDRPVMCQRETREQEGLLSSEKKMKPEDGHY